MVPLPPESRPLLIQKNAERFSEVVNMCATVERLLDALQWANEYRFSGHLVKVCHPTASSNKKDGDTGLDNDLVLIPRSVGAEKIARFEVSDVCGDGDGNDKERKDLENLEVLLKGERKIADALNPEWPKEHLFLVVAEKFGKQVMDGDKRTWRITKGSNAHCWYRHHMARKGADGREGTMIIEVIDGRSQADAHCPYGCCPSL
jgi:hypothetical protein